MSDFDFNLDSIDDLFDASVAERNGGGGVFSQTGYLTHGNTVVSIVIDPDSKAALIEEAKKIDAKEAQNHIRTNFMQMFSRYVKSYWQGKPSKRVLVWVIAYNAPVDAKKGKVALPEGWDGNYNDAPDFMKNKASEIEAGRAIFPLELPTSAFTAMMKLLGQYDAHDNEDGYSRFTEVDFGSGEIIKPGVLVSLSKEGTGKNTTYAANPMVVPFVSKAQATKIRASHVVGAVVLPPAVSLQAVADDYQRFQDERNAANTGQTVEETDLADEFDI